MAIKINGSNSRFFFIFSLILLILLITISESEYASAKALVTEKLAINDVVTKEETGIPATYNLTVENPNDYGDSFKIYTLLDGRLTPTSSFSIPAYGQIIIPVSLLPFASLKERCGEGMCSIQYFLKAVKSGAKEDSLLLKVLPINKILEINIPESISRDDTLLIINITNKENINFGNVEFTINSDFLKSEISRNLTLNPKSSEKFEIPLDITKLKTASAGQYKIDLTFLINSFEYKINRTINLKEVTDIVTTKTKKFSFLGFTKIITKKNEGNSPKFVTIELTKTKLEHAFTSSNIAPSEEKSSGVSVVMKWQRELKPGESLTVEVTTDYTIPTIISILIIIVVLAICLVNRPRVVVKKKAFRVKTKRGKFALKIILLIKNIGSEIKEVRCIDKFPHISKLYERFNIKPDKIEKNKLIWDFGTLAPGEEHIASYIIYSEITPVGTVVLPKAVVSYTNKKDKKKTVSSNELLVMGEAEKS